jgi:hypothetical protein
VSFHLLIYILLIVGSPSFLMAGIFALAKRWHWRRTPVAPAGLSVLEGLLYLYLCFACIATLFWFPIGISIVLGIILLSVVQHRIKMYVSG